MPSAVLPRARLERNLTDLPARLAARLGVDLDALCRELGVVRRWRVLRSGQALLSACLGYALLGLSLRANACLRLGGALRPSALGARLADAAPLLEALLARLLARALRARRRQGPGLRIYDTSLVTLPGGACWRVHVTLDPSDEAAVGLKLTPFSTGEWLAHAALGPGDVAIADRGLGRASELYAARERGAYALVRVFVPNVPLEAEASLAPDALVRRACRGDLETAVAVPDPEGRRAPLAARLLVLPLPAEKAARARQRLRTKARKEGRVPRRRARLLAGYVTLLTTVPAEAADARTLGRWYRVRWQVELSVKRAKSLLRLVPHKKVGERLARTLLLATLLVAAWLGEQLPPEAARRGVWPAMALLVVALVAALGAPLLDGLGARFEGLYPRPRRKRPRAHTAAAVALGQWRRARNHAGIRP